MAKVIPGDKEKDIYEDCINYIRLQKLRKEDAQITARLRDPQLDPQELQQLMQRQVEIQKSIKG